MAQSDLFHTDSLLEVVDCVEGASELFSAAVEDGAVEDVAGAAAAAAGTGSGFFSGSGAGAGFLDGPIITKKSLLSNFISLILSVSFNI